MSAKSPLLLIAGGCAAMVGAAALTLSLGSFFADAENKKASTASMAVIPVKKVKSVSLKQNNDLATGTVQVASVAARPAPASEQLDPAPQTVELHKSNPRWARNAALPREAKTRQAQIETAYADEAAGAADGADPFAVMGSGEVELEETMDSLPSPAPRKQSDNSADDEPNNRQITINTAANMRSAGRSGARVVGTIPAGTKVNVTGDCSSWCKVTYKGRTGYVWRSFVGGRPTTSRKRARNAAAAKPVKQATAATEIQKPSPGLFGKGGLFGRD